MCIIPLVAIYKVRNLHVLLLYPAALLQDFLLQTFIFLARKYYCILLSIKCFMNWLLSVLTLPKDPSNPQINHQQMWRLGVHIKGVYPPLDVMAHCYDRPATSWEFSAGTPTDPPHAGEYLKGPHLDDTLDIIHDHRAFHGDGRYSGEEMRGSG